MRLFLLPTEGASELSLWLQCDKYCCSISMSLLALSQFLHVSVEKFFLEELCFPSYCQNAFCGHVPPLWVSVHPRCMDRNAVFTSTTTSRGSWPLQGATHLQ